MPSSFAVWRTVGADVTRHFCLSWLTSSISRTSIAISSVCVPVLGTIAEMGSSLLFSATNSNRSGNLIAFVVRCLKAVSVISILASMGTFSSSDSVWTNFFIKSREKICWSPITKSDIAFGKIVGLVVNDSYLSVERLKYIQQISVNILWSCVQTPRRAKHTVPLVFSSRAPLAISCSASEAET